MKGNPGFTKIALGLTGKRKHAVPFERVEGLFFDWKERLPEDTHNLWCEGGHFAHVTSMWIRRHVYLVLGLPANLKSDESSPGGEDEVARSSRLRRNARRCRERELSADLPTTLDPLDAVTTRFVAWLHELSSTTDVTRMVEVYLRFLDPLQIQLLRSEIPDALKVHFAHGHYADENNVKSAIRRLDKERREGKWRSVQAQASIFVMDEAFAAVLENDDSEDTKWQKSTVFKPSHGASKATTLSPWTQKSSISGRSTTTS